MPIILTVTHLPSACSFFLSALQPLGYRYIYGRRGKIGLGVHEADFFIEQLSGPPGTRPNPNHIRFHAPSRAAVREFYAAALYAGAKQIHSPGDRVASDVDVFNTFVSDRDGNTIEVTFSNDPDGSLAGSDIDRGAVMNWQRAIADGGRSQVSNGSTVKPLSHAGRSQASARQSVADDGSHVSRRTTRSAARSAVSAAPMSKAPSAAPATELAYIPPPPSDAGDMPELYRQFSGPIKTLLTKTEPVSGMIPKRTVVGTMLGAAAGAAFAYAMCSSEDGKTQREQWRYMQWAGDGRPPQIADGSHAGPVSAKSQMTLPAPDARTQLALPEARSQLPLLEAKSQLTVRETKSQLSDALSRLALEPPAPPPVPEAPVPPSRYSTRSRTARSEIHAPSASNVSRKRSSSRVSVRTAPVGSIHSHRSSHRSINNLRATASTHRSSVSNLRSAAASHRSSSKHSHRSSRHSSRHSTSRHTAIFVPAEQEQVVDPDTIEVKAASEIDLDLDAATVAPSDSISCAGDKYSRSGARRSSKSTGGIRYARGWYAGNLGMDRIAEENIAATEPIISARRVSRMAY
ncbi:hypothetical protein NA57DRAFT_75467 [Rhizodiscina lignyota]|uniref:VOC domain-containing protein n=1 Tax=Rhizodiscina lignyota TaxID=1504668 RepID=A0A9P4IE77_9PEZI|nr:hypothetical protein NA57DRAFT_75467 [Rhizodiscina lignyota]